MTFKASIDGISVYAPNVYDAEEVTISTRHTTYTLWTDGEDLIIQCDGNFKTIHIENARQLRLETL